MWDPNAFMESVILFSSFFSSADGYNKPWQLGRRMKEENRGFHEERSGAQIQAEILTTCPALSFTIYSLYSDGLDS